MRAKEFITEAFDQPYSFKWEKGEESMDALAQLPDGSNLSIMFNQDIGQGGDDVILVEFYRNNSQEVTGEGDAQRIFSTVLAAIQQYINKYKPQKLIFSAMKDLDPYANYGPDNPKPNPESRAKLYDRLVQRYAQSAGYSSFREEHDNIVRYQLTRLRPAVTEGKSHDFMAGHCHVMAIALKQLHPDWQIRAHVGYDDDEADDTEYRVDHVYTVAPDGTAYDCRGRFDNEQQLVGPDTTGGVDTQYVNFGPEEIKQAMLRGELKRFTKQDLANAMQVATQAGKQDVSEAPAGYKEIEFVCVNPQFPDATDPALQKKMYRGLKQIDGVVPLWQEWGDYSEGQASLSAIYQGSKNRDKILSLAKQLGVEVDLEQAVSDDYVDRAMRGEHEGQQGLTEYKNTPLQDYNGLQFMIDSNHPYLRVEAFAPGSGQQLAQVDFKIDDQDELHPEDLHVEERWRGQGIAQIMYDFVKSKGYTIHRSWSQTDAGSEFWNKHRGQKRVWEQGVAEGKQPGQPVVDAILKVMPIAQEIWFHGSRATRSHRKNSDTDILVIVPDDLVGDQYLGAVRILQKLSTHFDNHDIQPTKAETNIHRIAQEEGRLLWSNKQAVAENFADGRNPQDKGDSKRHGINTKASVTSLRKTAKQGGRKGQLAHWLANMKSGRAKKK